MTHNELDDPLDELERENDTAQRVLEHLLEAASRLRSGTDVPPEEIGEGLRMVADYRKIHADRIDLDLQSEARRVAMSTCFDHLDTITRDHQATRDRLARADQAHTAYARGDPDGRGKLAVALEEFAEKEYEAMEYEVEYPLSCLRAALPSEAGTRVRAAFRTSSALLGDLEGRIERYLARGPAGGTPTSPGRRPAASCLTAVGKGATALDAKAEASCGSGTGSVPMPPCCDPVPESTA